MKKIAAINDISGFGKCSLTAAVPVISALGVQCCPLVTGVLSNQTGYSSYFMRDLTDDMVRCIDEWKKLNASFDALLSGFIASAKQGEIICGFFDDFGKNALVAVDPVMADDGVIGSSFDKKTMQAVFSLCKKADLITPNLTELCLLCGEDYRQVTEKSGDELLEKVRLMSKSLCTGRTASVVTTGIHTAKEKIANAVYTEKGFEVIEQDRLYGSFSGTGDIFSSIVTAQMVKGTSLTTAVKQASDFIFEAITVTQHKTGGAYEPDGTDFEKILYKLGAL